LQFAKVQKHQGVSEVSLKINLGLSMYGKEMLGYVWVCDFKKYDSKIAILNIIWKNDF
jgi:hypothetical protein